MPRDDIDKIIDFLFETKRLSHNFKDSKFSPLHLRTLHFVAATPQAVMKDLADLFGITPPSATSLVEGMERLGLLKRLVSRKDRRIVHLKITPKGRTLLKQGSAYIKQKVRGILSILTAEERQMLFQIIKKLSHHFNH